MNSEYVQFGCGLCAPAGWRNFDSSLTLWIERRISPLKPLLVRRGFADYPDNVEYGCIIRGLPIAPGSVKGVYSSHVLEHLCLDEFRTALRNVLTYLEPGGCFRVVLPDLEYMIANYTDDSDPSAAVRFIEATGMGEPAAPRGIFSALRGTFGRTRHRWLWDYKSLARELADAGFVDVRRAGWGDSADPAFFQVEHPDRWDNHLGLACRRPLVPPAPFAAEAIQTHPLEEVRASRPMLAPAPAG